MYVPLFKHFTNSVLLLSLLYYMNEINQNTLLKASFHLQSIDRKHDKDKVNVLERFEELVCGESCQVIVGVKLEFGPRI